MIDGRQHSAFAMTEPSGAGSDAGQLRTEAVLDGTAYSAAGLKWLIIGARGGGTWIVMARVRPNEHGADGPTLFPARGDAPGIELERVMNSMDRNYVEGNIVRFCAWRPRRSSARSATPSGTRSSG